MKRVLCRAVIIAAVACAPGGRVAHAGDNNPECIGDKCGAPRETGMSPWDRLLSWLGLE